MKKHCLIFSLGVNPKTEQAQWQAHKKGMLFVADHAGQQPTEDNPAWVVVEKRTISKGGKRVVLVDLLEVIPRATEGKIEEEAPKVSAHEDLPRVPSDRALRRKGIDPVQFRAQQEAQRIIAKTGVTPKNGVIQLSSRTLRQAAAVN